MRHAKLNRLLTVSFTTAIGLCLAPQLAEAAPSPGKKVAGRGGNFGLGLSLGDPTGLSMKLFLHPNHALAWDLGYSALHHYGHGRIGMDYNFHPASFVNNSVVDFNFYIGVGVGMGFWGHPHGYGWGGKHDYYSHDRDGHHSHVALFLRVPVLGLALHWKKVPLDTVFDGSWKPYVVRPDLPHGDFSIKVRYYF